MKEGSSNLFSMLFERRQLPAFLLTFAVASFSNNQEFVRVADALLTNSEVAKNRSPEIFSFSSGFVFFLIFIPRNQPR